MTDTPLILVVHRDVILAVDQAGPADQFLRRAHALVDSGVQMVCLLALSDSGTPSYDHDNAAALHDLGIPTFACTPDLMAAAIKTPGPGPMGRHPTYATTRLTRRHCLPPPPTLRSVLVAVGPTRGVMMKLTRLGGDSCGEGGVCPAVDLSEVGTLVFTGPVARYDGLRVGPGEQAVELTVELVREAMRALDNG